MSDSTSAMPNGFDILKKMWEAFSPPATFTSPLTQLMQSAAPLLDPNEIENRIAEMRAVEQWLTLNLNVLRSTIQAFEVQRATYATLRAFGTGSFGATDAPGTTDTGASPFGQAAAANFWRSPFAAAESAQDVEPEPQASAPEAEPPAEPEAESGAESEAAADAGAENEAGASASPFGQASSAYGALDPSMWFNAMRAQFDQIAAAAQAAGVSAAQMTEAAAAQMSDAAAKATKATKAAAPSAAKASDKTSPPPKRAAPGTKTASGTAAKRAPASKKTPAKTATKSAAAKTSAKTSAKTPGRTSSAKAEGDTPAQTSAKGRASGSTGKQSAWKW
ncbi:hypothetical protein LXM60_11975 [Pandoraea sputorum]|uniref:PhaM family polyhydroxyalkanoate granule multifunctional regulatory protein n=1 Tax=Pandoraea sputorum TaxID=93222 RepID=UPI001E5DCBB5|nr:PhaM family polyhydroxyalkanoate granule multifunctional regulatory protein [Pandoraea sputorum]MCE4060922.1 hypothetical protein [Pandoraea sputorum]